jgi:hypothetical protein
MSRTYSVSFEQVACSAPQDLVEIIGGSGVMLRILSVSVAMTDTSPPTNQQFAVRARRLPATVSGGSGGSSPTPQPEDGGDAAATFTAKANNTSKATTSGTASVLLEDGVNQFTGFAWVFPKPPTVGPAQAFVWELLSTPSTAIHLSGTVLVEEIGGG